MNHKRKRCRTAPRHLQARFPRGNPAWWRIIFNIRPKRRIEQRLCKAVMLGADPDGIAWPVAGRRPHAWYW